MLETVINLSLYIAATCAVMPSIRIVYYLHTTSATWASARDTCARYGGHLVNAKNTTLLKADVETLDEWLEWNSAFQNLDADVWSGLYKVTDPNNGTTSVKWHPCETFSWATSPSNIADNLKASPHYCASMDHEFTLQPTSCDTKLPYICEVDEGQCWFLPMEGKSFLLKSSATGNGDLNTCARNCRNDIESTGSECWGFVVKNGTCHLYRDSDRHAFIRHPGNYFERNENVTSYIKICTGGQPTTMKPVTEDASVQPGNAHCSPTDGTAGEWDSSVCYCDCDQPPLIMDPEYLALPIDEKVNKIINELKVNAKNTSASYRKLNSVEDNRPTARSIGAAGIIIMAVVFGGLVLLDLDVLVSEIWRLFCRRGDNTTKNTQKQ